MFSLSELLGLTYHHSSPSHCEMEVSFPLCVYIKYKVLKIKYECHFKVSAKLQVPYGDCI